MVFLAVVRALVLASLANAGGSSATPPEVVDRPATIVEYGQSLERLWLSTDPKPLDLGQTLHQLRNADGMVELTRSLPPDRRPRRILYLAAGSHLAPLALCEILPAGVPCLLSLTDIDPGVQQPITRILKELVAAECVTNLRSDPTIAESGDRRAWRFDMGGREVSVKLMLVGAGGPDDLIRPEWLEESDLVISHDWSGDPLVNLKVVYDLVRAMRSFGDSNTPMLMIEDLERHPYPIDLFLFSPVVRTKKPYGHRASDQGSAVHGEVELGEPLFRGGVLLGFADRWWREVDGDTLDGVFDLLVFNQFANERQNVLSGGDDPLLAPAILDWYSGFGYRTITGADTRSSAHPIPDVAAQSASAAATMSRMLRHHLACRLQLHRCLLHALAAGADIRSAMPAARFTRRPEADAFPDETMEAMYRQALRHTGQYRLTKEAERERASDSLAEFDSSDVRETLALCPVDEPEENEDPAVAWLERYRSLVETLESGE